MSNEANKIEKLNDEVRRRLGYPSNLHITFSLANQILRIGIDGDPTSDVQFVCDDLFGFQIEEITAEFMGDQRLKYDNHVTKDSSPTEFPAITPSAELAELAKIPPVLAESVIPAPKLVDDAVQFLEKTARPVKGPKVMVEAIKLSGDKEESSNAEVFTIDPDDRESVKILIEAAKLQRKKGGDYNNKRSRVKQADYYPQGIRSILDIINAKYLRIISVLDAMENDPNYAPNFESLEDSFKDQINYSSFGAAWCRGKIPGQNPNNDIFNRPKNV